MNLIWPDIFWNQNIVLSPKLNHQLEHVSVSSFPKLTKIIHLKSWNPKIWKPETQLTYLRFQGAWFRAECSYSPRAVSGRRPPPQRCWRPWTGSKILSKEHATGKTYDLNILKWRKTAKWYKHDNKNAEVYVEVMILWQLKMRQSMESGNRNKTMNIMVHHDFRYYNGRLQLSMHVPNNIPSSHLTWNTRQYELRCCFEVPGLRGCQCGVHKDKVAGIPWCGTYNTMMPLLKTWQWPIPMT